MHACNRACWTVYSLLQEPYGGVGSKSIRSASDVIFVMKVQAFGLAARNSAEKHLGLGYAVDRVQGHQLQPQRSPNLGSTQGLAPLSNLNPRHRLLVATVMIVESLLSFDCVSLTWRQLLFGAHLRNRRVSLTTRWSTKLSGIARSSIASAPPATYPASPYAFPIPSRHVRESVSNC